MIDNKRQEKGKQIALKSDLIRVSDYHYKVHSQTSNRKYDVVKVDEQWSCNCADHKFRHVCCKHIHAVEISIKLRNEARERNKITISPVTISNCKFCHSDNIKKFGIRRNKSGDIQRFVCSDCHKTFSINLGFERMKSNPNTITSALQLYFTGESLRGVTKFLRLQGTNVSHVTVYNWITKYTELMQKYIDKIVPQVGDAHHADEIFMKIKGDLKYLFALMDQETRYWIAQEVADRKEGHDARGLLQKAKQVTQKKPKVFITDGLPSYHEAYKKEYWTVKREDRTLHIRHIHLSGDRNNNIQERLNGEIRDREKVMRGLKKKDTPILTGYQIFHNYFRPHMGLEGKTPSEACGITIEGENKWISLIQNASMKKSTS